MKKTVYGWNNGGGELYIVLTYIHAVTRKSLTNNNNNTILKH